MKPRFTKHGRRMVPCDPGKGKRSTRRRAHPTPGSNAIPSGAPPAETGGGVPRRRRFLIDRLPGPVQSLIFRGYIRGDSYDKIRADVRRAGCSISAMALSSYWRRVFHQEVDRIRQARAMKEALMEALELEPGTENAQLTEELVLTALCSKAKELEKEPAMVLLREAREERRAAGGSRRGKKPQAATSPVEQARAIRRRWRELYGLEGGDDDAEEKDEPES